MFKKLEGTKDGLGTTRNQPYEQSAYLCVICALICYIPDSCDHETYLTVSTVSVSGE